jgi:hypothetical protein
MKRSRLAEEQIIGILEPSPCGASTTTPRGRTPNRLADTGRVRHHLQSAMVAPLRYTKGSAPAPVASPAQQGTTHAGNELKTG